MDRIFEQNPSVTPPTLPSPQLLGYPTETGTPTTPGAWWFYMITEELRAAVVAGGITPDAGAVNQLSLAITAIVGNGLTGYATQAWVTSQNYATVTYSSNASNLSNGTIPNARLPANIAVPGTVSAGATSYATANGDLSASRGSSGGSGVVYLGSNSTYLYFSGTAYTMPGYPVQASGFQVTSDERLKQRIEIIPDALEKICQLRGVTFEWRKGGRQSAGVIAQEVQRVLPRAVTKQERLDGNRQGHLAVDHAAMIGLLVAALKEERDLRVALEKRVARLEARGVI
jgi:hypothetical protein